MHEDMHHHRGPRHHKGEEHEEHRKGFDRRGRHHHEDREYQEHEEGRHRRGGGRRGRIERGMLRYLLLDVLRHGPKHGYEMIKWLEEQTHGRYAPSPGTVYPTLQMLVDQELLLTEQADDKSVYRLSEAGKAALQSQSEFIQEFWERYGHPEPPVSAILANEFIYEELQNLQSTVEKGVRLLTQQGDQQRLLPLRQTLERCKNEIRHLLTTDTATQSISMGNHNPGSNTRELEETIARLFASEDKALQQTLVRAKAQGLPSIHISALQGKLLQVLATACQARKILEIGSLAGYSSIWLARALPTDGRLITLEIDTKHAEIVRESFRQAQVDDRAEVRVGPAIETLPSLEQEGPFDLIFIDADKDSYPQYLAWALKLTHPGSIIIADNCVQGGSGLSFEATTNAREAGIRSYNQAVLSNPNLRSIALPINTGMTISVVVPS